VQKIISKDFSVFLFLFCTVFLVYGNILFGDFVFDDNIFIENNTHIRELSKVETIYSNSTTAGSGLSGDNFYRPNQQFIYAVLYNTVGLNPSFFHLVPLIFHVLNAFLVFLLFYRLGISREASFLGSLLFVLHPILTQAVSYISGLSEPLVAFTVLSTLLIFLEVLKNISYKKFHQLLLLGGVIFTAGLFSKENQMIAIPLMALILVFKWPKGEREKILRACVFIGLTVVLFLLYLYVRINFLNFTGNLGLSGDINEYTSSVWVRLATFIHAIPEYFKMILFPWHLNYEKPYVAYTSILNTQSVVSMFVIVLGSIGALYSLIKKSGKIFLGFTWFFVALIPVSGIIPVNSIYLEHWLYLPIIGVIFIFAHWFEEANPNTRKILRGVLFLVLILFSIRIFARNLEWGNPIKFYQNEIKYTQESARIYSNLGMELADKGKCLEAIPNYEKAIALADVYPQSHNNLAKCLEEVGRLEDSANEYLKALYMEPNFSYSLLGLYNLLKKVEDPRAENLLNLIESKRVLSREDIIEALK